MHRILLLLLAPISLFAAPGERTSVAFDVTITAPDRLDR